MAFVMLESFRLETPPRFKHYCREADTAVWHTPAGKVAVCEYCGRRVPAAELVVSYSVNCLPSGKDAVLSLPFRNLPDAERAALANPEQPDDRVDKELARAAARYADA